MTIPSYQQLMLPVLRLISEGQSTIPQSLPNLANEFGLLECEREELLPSGKQTLFANRAHWARTYLSKAGLISSTKRGSYILTESGRALLATNPAEISTATLKQFDSFRGWLARSNGDDMTKVVPTHTPSSFVEPTQPSNVTPEERIAQDYRAIESALTDELLQAVIAMTPQMFEQLIVDLLLAMGYGGGDRTMGERIGKSGDGGIDGIINEDALGLDAVYIQAKRYAVDNKVGRPALQAFVGSLTGEGANKGVFVTTSDFSKDAREYLNRVQHRIVLINGDRLARLMVQHEVGVRARKTYVIRSIDEDYFTET